MDAVKYLTEKHRMCKSYIHRNSSYSSCEGCPLSFDENGYSEPCGDFQYHHAQKAIDIVEEWSKTHPKKTYLSVFKEMFPNAQLCLDGTPNACVKYLWGGKCPDLTCKDCWNRPLDEN